VLPTISSFPSAPEEGPVKIHRWNEVQPFRPGQIPCDVFPKVDWVFPRNPVYLQGDLFPLLSLVMLRSYDAYLDCVCIPTSIILICSDCFSSCYGFASVAFEATFHLIEIQKRAFEWCAHLRRVPIPLSDTILGNGFFGFCDHHWLEFHVVSFCSALYSDRFVSAHQSNELMVLLI
jgi:hypothetical protein